MRGEVRSGQVVKWPLLIVLHHMVMEGEKRVV
jgi:hypothetical protein